MELHALGSSPPTSEMHGALAARPALRRQRAFDHNLTAELPKLAGRHNATAALDVWKRRESNSPGELVGEARYHKYPLGLVWMVVEHHRQPRFLEAFASLSQPCASWQGPLAGCSHSAALLTPSPCDRFARCELVKSFHALSWMT